MTSESFLPRIRQFPKLMWILLIGSFFTRGSYYMVWPFLVVILYDKFALPAYEVGGILSIAAVISVGVSFIGSTLSDRLGRNKLIYGCGILYIISFALLAQAQTITAYVLVITLCSIATALWRPLVSALIGDILDEPKDRELAMQLLYFMVNVGCAVGPMAGVWLGLTGEQSSFNITAFTFAMLLLALFWGFRQQKSLELKAKVKANTEDVNPAVVNIETGIETETNHTVANQSSSNEKDDGSITSTLRVLFKDKMLQCLILANIICMFIYAQMDTSLIQYLNRADVPELVTLVSSLIFTNALVIICSQFVLLKMMIGLSIINRIQIGLLLLFISQIWLAANPLTFFWGWVGAIVFMSLGEAILFPTMNVHIDKIAPNHLRGAYFGAATFYELGYAIAPLVGGIVLDVLSGGWLFTITAVLTLVVIYLYRVLDSMPRPIIDDTKMAQS